MMHTDYTAHLCRADARRLAMVVFLAAGLALARASTGLSAPDCVAEMSARCLYLIAADAAAALEPGPTRDLSLQGTAKGLSAIGETASALEIAARIASVRYRASLLADVARAQHASGQASQALETFRDAVEAAQGITAAAARDSALQEIVEAMTAVGEIVVAARLANRIATPLNRAGALRAVAAALAQRGAFDQARDVLAAVAETVSGEANPIARPEALRDVAIAQARAGAFDDAMATAEDIDWPPVKAWTLKVIAVQMAAAGLDEGAQATLSRIDDAADRAAAMLALARQHSADGKTRLARRGLATAMAVLEGVTGGEARARRARVQAEVAAEYESQGESASAARALDGAVAVARAIEAGYPRARAMGDVAKGAARAGELATALDLVEAHDWPALNVGVLLEIARVARANGDENTVVTALERAATTAASIEDATNRAWAMRDVALAWIEAGDIARALHIGEAMAATPQKAAAFSAAAAALWAAGQQPMARQTLASALEIAHAGGSETARAWALAIVADTFSGRKAQTRR